MPTCPYCAEEIAAGLDVCPYCRSSIKGPKKRRPRGDGSGNPCPKCGSDETRAGSWPWYLGTVGALIVRARECLECGHEYDANKPQADLRQRKLTLALVINGVGLAGIVAICGGLVFLFSRVR
jgi:hypothetical protein